MKLVTGYKALGNKPAVAISETRVAWGGTHWNVDQQSLPLVPGEMYQVDTSSVTCSRLHLLVNEDYHTNYITTLDGNTTWIMN